MRHLWLLLLIGCGGGGTSGEPITGTISLTYGSDKPKMAVGAAVQNKDIPTKMLVQIGSDNVDCDTYLDNFLDFNPPSGSFIYFNVDKTPGTTSASVAVMKSSSNSVAINEGPGSATIELVDTRITGSVAYTTTDQEVGMIFVAGTFDVKRCF